MARILALAISLCASLVAISVSPITATATGKYAEIPVPATMIYAGQPVRASLLRMRRVPTSYLERVRVVTDMALIDGKLARSTLVPGRPIPLNQIREPNVIEASKPVRTLYRIGQLEIVGEAMPLSSAAAGDRIRARNVDTGLVLTGTAMQDGTLLITGN